MNVREKPFRNTEAIRLVSAVALIASAAMAHGAECKVWDGDYVPAPQSAKSEVTLGAYIFPGWYRDEDTGDYPYRTHDQDSEWRSVAKQPKPRPLLGFYDDSLPEVNDWHIKWALDHGISFFCFDWYWNAGEHRLLRTLERGFLKAKYQHLMKFCIHWCNHALDWKGRPWRRPLDKDFQTDALVELTEYLADRYFRLPNYLTIDGRPALVVWDVKRVIKANAGPAGFARTLAQMNDVLRKRGLKDVYLVSIGGGKDRRAAGFSGITGYGYYGTDYDSKYQWRGGHSIPYEDMVQHYETRWRGITAANTLPYILPIGSNWDSRPRHRERARVIAGKTPGKFRVMCENSLKYVDQRVNMAIIEAWNEWGEGSFIEPDQEWGFAFLDVVRGVFTNAPAEHIDYVPTAQRIASYSVLKPEELTRAKELEKRPHPDPPLLRRTVRWEVDKPLPNSHILKRWDFEGETAEGWRPYHVEPFTVQRGVLSTTVTLDDPQLIVDNAGIVVEECQCIALRLKVSEEVSSCQVYWSTTQEPKLSARKAFRFRLERDGQWHTYQVMKKPEGKWRGTLKLLRFDMGGPGDTIEVDWIRVFAREH